MSEGRAPRGRDPGGVFSRLSRVEGVMLGLALLTVVGLADFLTGTEISFSIFYVAPIAVGAWFSGRGVGWAFAMLSTGLWAAADRLGGHETSHVLIGAWNALVRMGFFSLAVEALSRLRQSLERERLLARTDVLTGLANRRTFRELLAAERARAVRYGNPLSLVYLDVDDFKRVNDEMGHQEGDRVLVAIGELLKTRLRRTDTAARLGGDEFAVLMPQTTAANAENAMEKLREELCRSAEREGWPVTLSVGIVEFEPPPGEVDEMLGMADGLMYEVKRDGKDSIRVTTHPSNGPHWERLPEPRETGFEPAPQSSLRISRRLR